MTVMAAPLADEASAELDRWTASFTPDYTPAELAYALRMTLRVLAGTGRRPELAAAMLAELDRRHPPAWITVTRPDVVWHLVNRHGQPVEAGIYTAADGDSFKITRAPDMVFDSNDMPARVRLRWLLPGNDKVAPDYRYLEEMVHGWRWVPEHLHRH
ncbi:hypothetical protein [Catellatospora chokoriensis]|uniref:Uncharacterized protein n=1 Tax=Catellatospora chokoriensis TaxID=310353 RepID=A0A8J3NRZ8_9ACTN|nr:hypothetical protein [Catellatospora chokoriensis]GIF90011.1 hypothetical protein Cch02nite_34550 [Catellatospora chokoriensis]